MTIDSMLAWRPPDEWLRITAIDLHTAGEPFRVITSGFPPLEGDTILEKRRFARGIYDHLRTALMWEPRGHADMYGCLVTPPVSAEADFGVLFMHNEGFSTMCGHGIIAITTAAVETGLVHASTPETAVKIDTPAGLIFARARLEGETVSSVAFRNVPSFVLALDQEVHVPGIGLVHYDLSFGGAFYAYVRAEELGLAVSPADYHRLIEAGVAIKKAVEAARPVAHPFEPDLSFLYGTIFIGPPGGEGVHSRNVCVFAEGEVDRSPTGTGVSGRLAIHFARGEIAIGEAIVVESIIGSRFRGRVVERVDFGPYQAVIPEVEGSAYVTGRHEFLIDPSDPLRDGFFLGRG
ncbi:MAG TPA: proline racemase family protein [Anaerolineales bacterium]|nr:proline racemase family protein [Anaerolineales bacterium]